MRDHIQVAEQILAEIRGLGRTTKREFMMQLRNFIRDCKYYPPETRYPWDTLEQFLQPAPIWRYLIELIVEKNGVIECQLKNT